jgi:iron complex outermembrane receptor protein
LDRYLFTFTLRDDGSSRFHKNHRWGLFPSAAFAWRIKEEAFLKNVQAINDLKLRLDYGITGQQEGIGNYTYIPTYTPSKNHAFYNIGLINGMLYRPDAYNPNLTWEKTTTYNVGLDMALWNNRWTFSIDYYYRKTKDLLNNVYTAAGTNFSNVVQSNVGSLHNTGVEFSTTVRPIVKKDFTWELDFNATYNKNRIDELITGEGPNYKIDFGGAAGGVGGNIKAHHVGNAVGAFWVYQQVYDANGKIVPNTYVDRDGNGMINNDDRYYYYKPTPDVTMGLSTKFLIKNWDLGFSARANLGNYMYNGVEAGSANVGRGAVYVNAFASNRPISAVERGLTTVLTEQFTSDYWIENASFLKLDNITLGYSFPRLFGYDINGRIYATVQNVWTWTKYSGIDPEVNGGYDGDIYPRALTTILGLTLNF